MRANKSGQAKSLRRSMAGIHTWLGVLAGWILFAMFLTGTASYFRPEITRWMQPELHPAAVTPMRAAESAVAYLEGRFPGDAQWTIYLPGQRGGVTRVVTRAQPPADKKAASAARRPELVLDPASGAPLVGRETRGGEHFYRFHFQLQLPHPWGRWLAGVCAMFMLAAIISGVITHKRMFADFFTLRWGKGQRSWLDAHNAAAVLALPFHAMITYTCLITLVAMYMPWPILANYREPDRFAAEAFGIEPKGEAAGRAVRLAAVRPMIEVAMREWNGAPPRTIVIQNPGDAAATVIISRSPAHQLNARAASVTFSGTSGDRIAGSKAPGPAISTAGVMLGLHTAGFADPLLRWMFFLLGLTGSAMVGTGLVLWAVKRRRPTARQRGLHMVERLNIGVVACLPAGMAAYFLANRLIPAGLTGRAEMEVKAMFWVWFGLATVSLLRPVRRAWIETLSLAAFAFAAVPLVNALTTDRGFIPSLQRGDWLFVSFDAAMVAIAALLGFAAWHMRRPKALTRGRHRHAPFAQMQQGAAQNA